MCGQCFWKGWFFQTSLSLFASEGILSNFNLPGFLWIENLLAKPLGRLYCL
jgi:hypothetical protein